MNAPKFSLSYHNLPQKLHSKATPDRAPNPQYAWVNDNFATKIGMDNQWLNSAPALSFFSGNREPDGYEPLAMAYSGHQFGHFSPQLGDGRALLIGEFSATNNTLYDIHLKGSGATIYSRRGDGKSTLRAALKECLFSEYLAAINIPTTHALAVYTTGETVMRETPHQGAVLVRMAKSLIRVGTFQFASITDQKNILANLADFLITREFSTIDINNPNRHQQLFTQIIARQATLIASWMSQGFIHGVMNTDNMALSGETIDFGPCAFLERFKIDQVFSSIDKNGRYAWNKQADIAIWNLSKLASAMLPLFNKNQDKAVEFAEAELNNFSQQFSDHFSKLMMQKLGLTLTGEAATQMMNQTFAMLSETKADYTLFFKRLTEYTTNNDINKLQELCETPDTLENWLTLWQSHNKPNQVKMQLINPIYVPRFHLVEQALTQASEGDLTEYNRLLKALTSPYTEIPEFDDYALSPAPEDQNKQTFCET